MLGCKDVRLKIFPNKAYPFQVQLAHKLNALEAVFALEVAWSSLFAFVNSILLDCGELKRTVEVWTDTSSCRNF
jgi:hypothetical protein